ncbi:hypothetical protein CFO_g1892 [Ceratocystis platani]|uniref:USP domain-containing protein n=1 Tax=Ceratocystis fimbriata f. sp. platani TaxID=88771 RepID=A0A0F8B5F6_CERFI|nr:hypothetical protein CFO_g1892 [Ceratocystis platani]
MVPTSKAGPAHSHSHSHSHNHTYSLDTQLLATPRTKGTNAAPIPPSRPLRHLDDLKLANPDIDPSMPISRVVDEGNRLIREAASYRDISHQIDLAFESYLKAFIISAKVIPVHREASAMVDRKELKAAYTRLQADVNKNYESFEQIKLMIIADNERSGVTPLHTRSALSNNHSSSHSKRQPIAPKPDILMRDNLSAAQIEESLVVSPVSEEKIFEKRHEFDLVVYYDQSTVSVPQQGLVTDPNLKALQSLHRALLHLNCEKELKNPPRLLTGGVDAWIDHAGPFSLQESSTSKAEKRKPNPNFLSDGNADDSLIGHRRKSVRYIVNPLKSEDIQKWEETIQAEEETASSPTFIRSRDEFLRRFPEVLPDQEESMTSSTPPPARQPPIPPLPRKYAPVQPQESPMFIPPPQRPPPALPRPDLTGLSHKDDNDDSNANSRSSDQLHDETDRFRNLNSDYISAPISEIESSLKGAMNFWNTYCSRSQSIADKYFRGVTVEYTQCSHCKRTERSASVFFPLYLTQSCGPDAKVQDETLIDTMQSSFSRMYIDDRRCEKCNKSGCERWSELARLPPLLAVVLPRGESVGSTAVKLCNKITWDFNNFDVSRFCLPAAQRTGAGNTTPSDPGFAVPAQYECYGVIVHRGASVANSGHYYSYVRKMNDRSPYAWYKCNDSVVTSVTIGSGTSADQQNEVFKSGANAVPYVVFFKRKNFDFFSTS